MEYQKKNRGDFNRALLGEELEAFLGNNTKKPLAPFVQLVKNNPELELCFRGNSSNTPRVCIYENNNIVFSVQTSGRIQVSFNHARYCKDWKKYFEKLKKYGFTGSEMKTNEKGQIDIGYLYRSLDKNKPLTYKEVETLYKDVLKPVFNDYFSAAGDCKVVDYFKHGEKVKPKGMTEKKRQQEIYSQFKYLSDGYFFYDLEFAQRHKDKEEQDNDKNNNKPDMQAIRFGLNGTPEKIVFVEVKCTKDAMNGKSGLTEHLKKMKSYEKLEERRKEACDILNQYAQLELRGLTKQNIFNYNDFKNLKLEILLVFTDDAIKIWEKDDAFKDDRKRTTLINSENPNIRLYRL